MKRKDVQNFVVTLVLVILSASVSAATATGVDLGIGTTSLGTVIVDGKGMTAYFYDPDIPNSGVSSCTGRCLVYWPAITSASQTPVVTGITAKITVIGSTNQIEISGRPIYTYIGDKKLGDANGQGIGGIWYVVSPEGIELSPAELARESKASVPTKASSVTPKPKSSKIATSSKRKAKTTHKTKKTKVTHKTSAKPKTSSTYPRSRY